MGRGHFPTAQMDGLMDKQLNYCSPIAQPCSGSTCLPHRNSSLFTWVVGVSWEATESRPTLRPADGPPPFFHPCAYLFGEPLALLRSPVHNGHLPQVLHSQL